MPPAAPVPGTPWQASAPYRRHGDRGLRSRRHRDRRSRSLHRSRSLAFQRIRAAADLRTTMPRKLAAAVLTFSVAACTSIGPGTVPHDRLDYASSIGNSWKEQTLLNIVKLRYADMPIFLEVSQVIAGYQLQSALTGSFAAGNVTAGLVGPFTATGTANAAGTYTDRPTVIYQPLTGVDFLKRLMTPVPPSSILFMLQSGYSAERIMPIMLDSINGLNNESNRLSRMRKKSLYWSRCWGIIRAA